MSLNDERAALGSDERITLRGIPAEANHYPVNGRTPLEWCCVYYKVNTAEKTGIINDANRWFAHPRDIVPPIGRIVHMSVETTPVVSDPPNLDSTS